MSREEGQKVRMAREESADASADGSADGLPEKVRMPSPQDSQTSGDAAMTREKRESLAVEPVITGVTGGSRKEESRTDFDSAPTPGAPTAATLNAPVLTRGNPKDRTAKEVLDHVLALVKKDKDNAEAKANPADPTETIGQHLVALAYDVSDTTFYGELSDGEFAARCMTRRTSSKEDKWVDVYPHRAELRAACIEAIRAHDQEAYEGRRSLAKVMGTAMGLLNSQRIKAPGGWYPAMKKLRGK